MIVADIWKRNIEAVTNHISENGYKDFLREPTIRGTMFVGEISTTIREYQKLVKNRNWDTTWKNAIYDDGKGNPERFSLNTNTSGNYIHCAYHLSQFEEYHKVAVKDLDLIIEAGCGYGSMAKVCRQAGFKGKYVLFDLEIFNKIQKYYLGKTSIYEYISDIEKLLKFNVDTKKSMFISTWAASEMPIDLREKVLKVALKTRNVLLAYQCQFEGEDIQQYFDDWYINKENFSWIKIDAEDDNHRYLFGRYMYD